jgi:5-formyltetrahydrofolate cyclo-ligase
VKRHDADAAGDPELLANKAELRQRVWDAMVAARVARFPGAQGRIPNFVGAERAARRLRDEDIWRAARTLKCNPDSPQLPVRVAALEDQKLVYMAVPRLAAEQPFFLLDPAHLPGTPRASASIRGASRAARKVRLDELAPVDLVIAGSVAVSEDGARLGKGGGYSDLELALATEAGLVGAHTRIATTVHDVQVLAPGEIPTTAHDIALDLIVTPERVIHCAHRRARATIRWDELSEEKIAAIPLLAGARRLDGARQKWSSRIEK